MLFAAKAEQDAIENEEFAGNLERKNELLVEAEKLLTVTDVAKAKQAPSTSSGAGTRSARCPATRSGRSRTACARWSRTFASSTRTTGAAPTRRRRRARRGWQASSRARPRSSSVALAEATAQGTRARSRTPRRPRRPARVVAGARLRSRSGIAEDFLAQLMLCI
ncbi:MAG: DUF349 domain-containing protein [Schumannella sp.]